MTVLAGLAGVDGARAAPGLASVMATVSAALSARGPAPAVASVSDLGPVAIGSPTAMTIYLAPRNPAALANFVAAVQTPGNPDFHKFLTRAQFVSRYAPTEATIEAVESSLTQLGFTIGVLYANHLALEVTAPAATTEAAFGLSLHQVSSNGRRGTVSMTPTVMPAALGAAVRGVGGFDTLIARHPGRIAAAPGLSNVRAAAGDTVTDQPGFYTPQDYETRYDVLPLVQSGATGKGTTVAIVTLSDFDVADATAFFKQVGVTVGPNHVRKIDVDGGTEASTPYSDGDPGESDLDTQQAGAIAPNASILAYVTPNISSSTFINGFEAAASDNAADVVSCSWGEAELNFFANALTGGQDQTFYLQAFHDVFSEMAAQGQTIFTDADDNGAFEVNRFQYPVFPTVGSPPAYTPVYSIHSPSSDPLVTAAGGTTTPFTAAYQGYPKVDVTSEQAWSWSYFPIGALQQDLGVKTVVTQFEENFAVGGGGGVSIYWPAPSYQAGLAGVTTSAYAQALFQLGTSPTLLATEPGGFAGRNIPDLSANADPDTGYFYVQGGTTYDFYGGTSFVAPQFAGTLALIVEKLGHRVGQLNPLLYTLQAQGAAAARDITTGDNWGYLAQPGYDVTTGLGVIDAAKLYQGLKKFD
jgi:subtilase family serine protease